MNIIASNWDWSRDNFFPTAERSMPPGHRTRMAENGKQILTPIPCMSSCPRSRSIRYATSSFALAPTVFDYPSWLQQRLLGVIQGRMTTAKVV